MLASGTVAQTAFAVVAIGLPVLAPALRDAFDLTLAEVGIVLASTWIGPIATLLPWGLLADRIGERVSLAVGLGGCGLAVSAAAAAPGLGVLIALLVLAGAAGASVNSASGRAVMRWFDPAERGLALGLRQTAIPIAGVISGLGLPFVERRAGLDGAFLFLGALCLAGALLGGLLVRDRGGEGDGVEAEAVPWTLRDTRLWTLSLSGGFYLVAQIALTSFVVLFLHDERGLSTAAAGGVLVGMSVLGGVLRVGLGRWSDLLGARVLLLRRVGVGSFATLALVAVLARAPLELLVPAFVVAGAVSMAWNGLSFTAAAELAGLRRSGAAIGFQQTVLSVMGVLVPPAFAFAVTVTSWRAAFAFAALGPLAGWVALRPLRRR